MPALYTRLTGGRLWYTPGFRGEQGKEVWRRLLRPVARGKVVPIIGPRLLETACGTSHETATRLAGAHHYPLAAHEWDDLPRVTELHERQGVALQRDPGVPGRSCCTT
jgi:hypothetical protein